MTDFRKRGFSVPKNIVDDLKSAKTLINVFNADPTRLETSQKIEEYLNTVEAFLFSEGQKFGDKYVKEWLKKLENAGKVFGEESVKSRFVPGLPKEHRWIRVKLSEELSFDALKTLAEELNLLCELQNGGYLLVYGRDEALKDFIKKMATGYRSKARK